jgi:hypothetical protein
MISGKEISRIIFLVFLLGACLRISFNYLIWLLPARPATRDIALADLEGDGDVNAFLVNGGILIATESIHGKGM